MARRGLTLVEVLAALAILGGMLASIAVARGRLLHQWTLAQQKVEAIQAADALLEGWWREPELIEREGVGMLSDGLRWRTGVVDPNPLGLQGAGTSGEDASVLVERVRLEVTNSDDMVLTHVDLFLPPEPSREREVHP